MLRLTKKNNRGYGKNRYFGNTIKPLPSQEVLWISENTMIHELFHLPPQNKLRLDQLVFDGVFGNIQCLGNLQVGFPFEIIHL